MQPLLSMVRFQENCSTLVSETHGDTLRRQSVGYDNLEIRPWDGFDEELDSSIADSWADSDYNSSITRSGPLMIEIPQDEWVDRLRQNATVLWTKLQDHEAQHALRTGLEHAVRSMTTEGVKYGWIKTEHGPLFFKFEEKTHPDELNRVPQRVVHYSNPIQCKHKQTSNVPFSLSGLDVADRHGLRIMNAFGHGSLAKNHSRRNPLRTDQNHLALSGSALADVLPEYDNEDDGVTDVGNSLIGHRLSRPEGQDGEEERMRSLEEDGRPSTVFEHILGPETHGKRLSQILDDLDAYVEIHGNMNDARLTESRSESNYSHGTGFNSDNESDKDFTDADDSHISPHTPESDYNINKYGSSSSGDIKELHKSIDKLMFDLEATDEQDDGLDCQQFDYTKASQSKCQDANSRNGCDDFASSEHVSQADITTADQVLFSGSYTNVREIKSLPINFNHRAALPATAPIITTERRAKSSPTVNSKATRVFDTESSGRTHKIPVDYNKRLPKLPKFDYDERLAAIKPQIRHHQTGLDGRLKPLKNDFEHRSPERPVVDSAGRKKEQEGSHRNAEGRQASHTMRNFPVLECGPHYPRNKNVTTHALPGTIQSIDGAKSSTKFQRAISTKHPKPKRSNTNMIKPRKQWELRFKK